MKLAANHGNWNSIPAFAGGFPEPASAPAQAGSGVLPWKVV